MRRLALVMPLLFCAQLLVTDSACANPVVCKQTCIAEHQNRTRICTGRACVMGSARMFNACDKQCDQVGKLH